MIQVSPHILRRRFENNIRSLRAKRRHLGGSRMSSYQTNLLEKTDHLKLLQIRSMRIDQINSIAQ